MAWHLPPIAIEIESHFKLALSICKDIFGANLSAIKPTHSSYPLVIHHDKSIDYQNNSFYDVKQSENFGTEKSGWIKEWKQARTTKYMAHKNDNEEYQSQYLDTTQFTKKYNDIDLTSKKNSTSSDNKEVLTKDELMLKYLLENLDEQNKAKIK